MIRTLILLALLCFGGFGWFESSAKSEWKNVTRAAEYPLGYNYPVFVVGKRMYAMNNGAWASTDGKSWAKTELPESGLNSAYQKYVQFNGAVYSLGKMSGNYISFTIEPKILRTRDMKTWEPLSETSNIPKRIFYGLTVFNGKIWMLGGFDGKRYHNDIWSSADGVRWKVESKAAAWSPRNISSIVVFNGKIWILGGGVIDGEMNTNPGSDKEIWTSVDGRVWEKLDAPMIQTLAGTPVVFNDKLLLVGANRGETFESAVLMTSDGKDWRKLSAPWSPRGGVAAWNFGGKLFMTGGKSSHTENGEIKFVYSNDVWSLDTLPK
ncbi:MAG TPA: hypothetical protein PKA82_08905 [Pyrinomonadaceae bacterium]|nr:hypothetical protein [Pyrinomonadaceae bacterium]